MSIADAIAATRWPALIATVFLALLLAANVPFYSGGNLGTRLRWRMEHGRLSLKSSQNLGSQGFYVAINNEGLRWTPAWRRGGSGEWELTLPLWLPLVASCGWLAFATGVRTARGRGAQS